MLRKYKYEVLKNQQFEKNDFIKKNLQQFILVSVICWQTCRNAVNNIDSLVKKIPISDALVIPGEEDSF